MKPTAEELKQEKGYQHVLTVPFDKLLPFLFENMKPNTKTMGFFYFFLVICALSVLTFLFQPGYTFAQLFWFGLAGFVSSFTVLVPLHELLHGIAFKLFKAGKINYGKDLKQMMFYVTADNFVMNRREFTTLALLPFAIITILLLLLELILPNNYIWFFLSAIFWHATMCIGDFAMLAFFEKFNFLELFTFDDAQKKITYFYCKEPDQPVA